MQITLQITLTPKRAKLFSKTPKCKITPQLKVITYQLFEITFIAIPVIVKWCGLKRSTHIFIYNAF